MKSPRPILRILGAAIITSIEVDTAGCSQTNKNPNPTSPSPPSSGSTINYSALGASDAWGIGSSVQCATECSNGTGYVFVTERTLRSQGYTVNLNLLAVPTATIGPDFQALGTQYNHIVLANLLAYAPFVTSDTTVVTIFTGGNDIEVIMAALNGGAGASNQAAFIDSQIQAFGADYKSLLAIVRTQAPSARIIAINLPNFAGIPLYSGSPLSTRQAVQRASVGMTTGVINGLTSQNITVIDLMCDPRFYQGSIYSSDGFHPNDSGYSIMAGMIVQAVTAPPYPAPAASCSQMTLVP